MQKTYEREKVQQVLFKAESSLLNSGLQNRALYHQVLLPTMPWGCCKHSTDSQAREGAVPLCFVLYSLTSSTGCWFGHHSTKMP